MFDLRFINVAADDTYCMAEAKAPQNLQHINEDDFNIVP
jgi:hypothetical protein